MSEPTEKIPHGDRKVKATRETSLLLFAGFLIAAWLKVPLELYATFALGLFGKLGAFVYGNVQEHKAKAPEVAFKPATQAS
jgi:mannose/fructose/N-acetylgalactosamine-specific phosphotransferase system component IIC